MSMEWLFYGVGVATIGGLVLALVASLIAQQQRIEGKYLWTIFTGAFFILIGFILQATFLLPTILCR